MLVPPRTCARKGRSRFIVKYLPANTFTHQAITTATPDVVWRRLQQPQTWGAIGGVSRVENARYDNAGGLAGYRFVVNISGVDYRGTVNRTSMVEERQMVMSIESGQLKGMIGVQLHPLNPGTRVKVSMTMRPNGFLGQMMFGVISKGVASGFDDAVENFVDSLG